MNKSELSICDPYNLFHYGFRGDSERLIMILEIATIDGMDYFHKPNKQLNDFNYQIRKKLIKFNSWYNFNSILQYYSKKLGNINRFC